MLLRADSAFYSHAVVTAAARAGADVSITARMDPNVKRAIATIDQAAWTKIEYTDAIRDEETGLVSGFVPLDGCRTTASPVVARPRTLPAWWDWSPLNYALLSACEGRTRSAGGFAFRIGPQHPED